MPENEFDFDEGQKPIERIYSRVKQELLIGNFKAAGSALEEIMKIAFDSPQLYENEMYAVAFWENREEKLKELEAEKKECAFTIIEYFDSFEKKIELKGGKNLFVYEPVKMYVFSKVKRDLKREYEETGDEDVLIHIARAFLELKEYQNALNAFEYLLKKNKYDSYILSYISEAHYMLGDVKRSQVFLREALFYDPFSIPYERFENNIIEKLWEIAALEGYTEKDEIKVWAGVYGEIRGILNVKKKLSDDELISLRKNTAKFEAAYKNNDNKRIVEPRLLLAYFWLVAQLVIRGGKQGEIEMLLNKIKSINEKIYDEYVLSL